MWIEPITFLIKGVVDLNLIREWAWERNNRILAFTTFNYFG